SARANDRGRAGSFRFLQPVLEEVDIDAVVAAAPVFGPDIALGEADEIERLLGEPIRTVSPRLRVREGLVHPLYAADLALYVTGGAVMALVKPGGDPHPLTAPISHPPSLASSSPAA